MFVMVNRPRHSLIPACCSFALVLSRGIDVGLLEVLRVVSSCRILVLIGTAVAVKQLYMFLLVGEGSSIIEVRLTVWLVWLIRRQHDIGEGGEFMRIMNFRLGPLQFTFSVDAVTSVPIWPVRRLLLSWRCILVLSRLAQVVIVMVLLRIIWMVRVSCLVLVMASMQMTFDLVSWGRRLIIYVQCRTGSSWLIMVSLRDDWVSGLCSISAVRLSRVVMLLAICLPVAVAAVSIGALGPSRRSMLDICWQLG